MSKKYKEIKSGKKKSKYNSNIKKETINQKEIDNKKIVKQKEESNKTITNEKRESVEKNNKVKNKNNKIKKEHKKNKDILKNVISKIDNIKDKTKISIKKYLTKIKNKYIKINDKKNHEKGLKNKRKELKNRNNKAKKKQKERVKLDYNSISIEQIETELKKEKYKSKYFNILSSTIYGLIIVAALAAIIATLVMPVFEISGSSMAPELDNGDLVISIKTKKLDSGDIIAFYHGNKILVKRVIASAGEWVVIDKNGKVYINGQLLQEPYIEEFMLGEYDIKFPYQVPAESYFVLGDNRTIFTDSRNSEIGTIKNEDIIGKILFKLWDTNK